MRRKENFPDNGFEAWGGYMQAKIAKLEEQFDASAGKVDKQLSNIFSGVSIFVNGFTIPSADELKGLMSAHGGIYHTYHRSNDYIIASNLPDTKVKKMNLSKVVRPEWITDSISSNCLLNYREYLLYKNQRGQQSLHFDKIVKDEIKIESKTSFISDTIQNTGIDSCKTEPVSLICESKSPDKIPAQCATYVLESNDNIPKQPLKSEVTKTAADPNFISEFYNNSRLHHISQLGACFKQHVNDLRESSNFVFDRRKDLQERILALTDFKNLSQINFEGGKTIMHIDMDCFFVSVGLRKRPDLKGKPVAVTHSKGRQARPKRQGVDRQIEFNLYRQKQAKKLEKATGVPEDEIVIKTRVDGIADEDEEFGSMSEIASCSYEARAKGVGNGMFMGQALRLCPDLQTIQYDFEGYKEVAHTLYNTITQYTLDIEAVSCDEMYVDCTELLSDMGVSVQDFATVLRNEIKFKTGCPCSTGFGGNRLQARLATKRAKPDGQFFLSAELVEDFMHGIQLKDLPGVGRQTAQKLEAMGHLTCLSLQSLTLGTLQQHLGNKTGSQLYDQCRGRDAIPLSFHTVRKSVSAEVNYGIRFENNDQCIEFLKQLSAEVQSRMKQFKVVGKCITLKLMVRAEDAPVETAKFMGHGFCNTINKSNSLNIATNDLEVITKEVILLFQKQKIDPKEMRGIGIQITKLEPIVNKNAKGAISKFFTTSNNKVVAKRETTEQNNEKSKSEVVENKMENRLLINLPTTPKKTKNKVSPTANRSPILVLKSPKIKRRGKPPKQAAIKPTNKSSNNLMNKFLQIQTSSSESSVQAKIAVKKEKLADIKCKVTDSKPKRHGLIGIEWDKVRELLRAWLDSGEPPLPCDVAMITEYLREMVITKNIDKVYILLNFLRRRTHEIHSKDWIDAYENITEHVQSAMIAVYGKKLMIGD